MGVFDIRRVYICLLVFFYDFLFGVFERDWGYGRKLERVYWGRYVGGDWLL